MKRYSLIALLFIVSAPDVFSQDIVEKWTTLRSLETSGRYDDVFFINADTGWVAGGPGGFIFKTTSGGTEWTKVAQFDDYLRSIEFLDKNIGLCGGLSGTLYRTTDGGTTWTNVGASIEPPIPGVCGLAKADDNTIYGVGVWSEPAYVVKSVDKGETWQYIDMAEHAVSLIDAYFFDADHGFVTGTVSDAEGGVVLYTADGGQTWEEKFRTGYPQDRIWKIQSPDGVHFFGSIEAWTGDTRMIKSNDMGQTWEMIQVTSNYFYIQAVGFLDPLHGWTGGHDDLFETKDGGISWDRKTLGSSYDRFQKLNDSTAVLTGALIYKFTKRKAVDTPPPPPPVITGVNNPDAYDPVHYVSVSPNPTSGKADIHVNFGVPTMAHIHLCSTTGQDVTDVFQGRVQKGKRVFSIDVSHLKSQTYIVIVKTNEGMERTKFIKASGLHGR